MASEKHKQLAKIIKDCHSELRDLCKEHGDNAAWQQHVNDKKRLEQYANAMHQLAEIWEQNSQNEASPAFSRIKWATGYCLDYFDNGICLKKRAREIRQLAAWYPNIAAAAYQKLDSVPPERIFVLDVGSCYNPFSNVERFEVTALDLSPAIPQVLPGDFLHINISKISSPVALENGVVFKVQAAYFHCVIFSLLLEYLPSSEQRIACCRKAYEALRPEGILLIITPDSEHVGKNAAFMKQWRYTLATLGFMRVRFEKLACITCLAFRKSIHRQLTEKWAKEQTITPKRVELNIPQDEKKL